MTGLGCVRCDANQSEGFAYVIYNGNSYCGSCYRNARKLDGYYFHRYSKDGFDGEWRPNRSTIPDKRICGRD